MSVLTSYNKGSNFMLLYLPLSEKSTEFILRFDNLVIFEP